MTGGEVEARSAALPGLARQRLKGAAERTTFVEDVIDTRLAATEAARQGLLRDPAIRAQLDSFLAEKLFEHELSQEKLKAEISEADVRRAFEANKAVYDRPEQWRLSHLFLAAPEQDPKMRAAKQLRARELRDELRRRLPKEPLAFERLAAVHSEDAATRPQDGLLGTFSKQDLSQRFGADAAEVVATLKPGEVSEVIAAADGFHLFKVLARKAPTPFVYEAVKNDLLAVLVSERRTDLRNL